MSSLYEVAFLILYTDKYSWPNMTILGWYFTTRQYLNKKIFFQKCTQTVLKRNKTVQMNNKVFWPNCVSFHDRLFLQGILREFYWMKNDLAITFLLSGGRSICLHPKGSHLKISSLLYWLSEEEFSREPWCWWKWKCYQQFERRTCYSGRKTV